MNGIEYVAIVFGMIVLIICVMADNWKKKTSKKKKIKRNGHF